MARSVVRCRTSCCLPSEGEKARDGGWPRRRCMRRMCRRRRRTAPQPDQGGHRGSTGQPRSPGQCGEAPDNRERGRPRTPPTAPDSAKQRRTAQEGAGRRRTPRGEAPREWPRETPHAMTRGGTSPPLHFRPPSSACLSPDAHLSRGVQTRGPSCVPVHALRHPVGKGNTPPSSARMEGPRRFRPGHPRRPPNLSDRLTTPACAERGIKAQNIIQHT